WLLEAVVAIVDTLAIEKPIFLGCSVGGQLALDLAAHHHDKFKAFLSLNGTLDNAAADDPFMIAWNDLCRDNRISTEAYSTGNFNATSPLAPEAYRRELYWLYRSNFPGVYAGDNDYFMVGHDLKIDGHLMRPDKTPVYALAGEYDPVSWMEDHGGPAVAREFPGVIYRELKGIGHFAPTDTPIEFRNAMLPIFDEVLERVRSGRTATV
ncbi:MAG: alpha/beta fold hydrolase, partial [Mycetocola sp.]